MQREVTLLIKTFERPECLDRLLRSIRHFHPELPVHVADDSRDAPAECPGATRYLRLPYDSGISVGRNALVATVETPFMVLLDDDFVFCPQTRLASMRQVLLETSFNVVGGSPNGSSGGVFQFLPRRIVVRAGFYHQIHEGLPLLDCAVNFFMARTEAIREVGWDPRLKLNEHADFFLRGRNTLHVTQIPSYVVHQRSTGNPPRNHAYHRMRSRSEFKRILCEKWNVDRIDWCRSPHGRGLRQWIDSNENRSSIAPSDALDNSSLDNCQV